MNRKALVVLAFITILAVVVLQTKKTKVSDSTGSSQTEPTVLQSSSEKPAATANPAPEAPQPQSAPMSLDDPKLSKVKSKLLQNLKPSLRERVSFEVRESTENSTWLSLKVDGVPVETAEAKAVKNTQNGEFDLQVENFSLFSEKTPVFKSLPNAQVENAAFVVLNTERYKAQIVEPVKKIWQWKPGLPAIPAMEVKIKTSESIHSGEVIRIDTRNGNLLKKYRTVRH
jgi:hypothetical protein